mmetsp:Transcript_10952/g.13843  ORF Transcript_10952/g.13843 Transcript_10952/m.13843 type:complete len:84 (-) Transcript_10952:439-690(-)|eukprot:CAMPEP_0170470422 /NCGR_PEP_ID=MMETSP0123-20130129/12886_1 /TAXON_ID=182087 /ORGANISM="Favella ehrenbergii, Strain Fehren 1" /LENGTH=83 /DNA_ID=CAMNT_0010737543 /DNA_START=272 /DNA_END=523 /DNA_ORIENTATION=+
MSFWFRKLEENLRDDDIPIIVVGNKIDLERIISADEGHELASGLGYSYFETSAKTGEGVKQMMKDIFEKTCAHYQNLETAEMM